MCIFKRLILAISIINTICNGCARERIDFGKPKGGIKIIQSYESNEVIDCVDIFKQSAFDHPLLKNHTVQMKPSSNREVTGAGYGEGALSQAWWKYGECPDGTIPVRRPQQHDNRTVIKLTPNVRRLDETEFEFVPPPGHEYAQVSLIDGNYMGAHAKINAWNPTVRKPEFSNSQIWLTSASKENLNTVQAGWMVDTNSYLSNQAKIFISWTIDGHQQTGCYNLECPGFVQTNNKIALGSPVRPISTFDGPQYDMSISIKKNDVTGHWWVRVMDEDIGYWPREIFTSLSGPAEIISWGGEILNTGPDGRHTSTQMGAGRFPSEGYGKASYFRNLKFVDNDFIERDPENLVTYVTRPECYDLRLNVDPFYLVGVNFYYGGPGFSAQCAI